MSCPTKVKVSTRLGTGSAIMRSCGESYNGRKRFCPTHQAQAERQCPQGWRCYPGDTCQHGKYVGGCGADLMCGACELGANS